jgi:Tfp pilus assembly protein PilF
MKYAPTLALALAAACAAPQRPAELIRPRQDLIPVSRALTAIDAADRRGEIAAERQRWTQASQANPRDPAARFLSISAQPAGEERWAEFKALAGEFPDAALGQVGMARTYVAWGTLDQADRAVRAALDIEPDCWLAVLVRADVAERRARLEAAAADFGTVLGADPENPEAHLGLARVARASGDAARAEVEASQALRAAPDHAGALALLAGLAEARGDRAVAIERWQAVTEASPRDRAARVTLAKLLLARDDAFGSLEQWKAAVALKEDPESLVSLVQAARLAGDAAAEAKALERLSVLDPAAAEWRRIAEIRLAAKDVDGAEKALRLALAREPRDAQANLGLARVHVARGQPQDAVEAYRASGDAGAAERQALEARLNLEKVERKEVGPLQKAVQALVDRTFRARRAENTSLSGTLRVRVTADAAGAATLVEVLEDSIHDADVRACAYWNLRDATYPQDKPGRYSFTFSFR